MFSEIFSQFNSSVYTHTQLITHYEILLLKHVKIFLFTTFEVRGVFKGTTSLPAADALLSFKSVELSSYHLPFFCVNVYKQIALCC